MVFKVGETSVKGKNVLVIELFFEIRLHIFFMCGLDISRMVEDRLGKIVREGRPIGTEKEVLSQKRWRRSWSEEAISLMSKKKKNGLYDPVNLTGHLISFDFFFSWNVLY